MGSSQIRSFPNEVSVKPTPYLFLLCAEGLGAVIKRAYENRMQHGTTIAKSAPTITHLFFTDDSVIYTRATVTEAETIVKLLKEYEVMLGQMINMEKRVL